MASRAEGAETHRVDQEGGDNGRGRTPPLPASALLGDGDSIRRDFEDLGLNNYEARVLVALVRFGSASAADLARLSGVHRTSVYPVLQELSAKGLALPVPGKLSQWVSPGPDDVLDCLYAIQEQRLHDMAGRVEQTRKALATMVAASGSAPLPFVHLRGAAQVLRIYEDLLARAEIEVLVFNRPPYTWTPGKPNEAILEALGRGVRSRVLYQEELLRAAEADGFRQEQAVYLRAGVEGRVVDELPCKLVVVDCKIAILPMAEPASLETGYPTTLLIEHPGVAALQADAFEQRWATGRPLTLAELRT
ncbi:MAG TPA: helix-turn-helix domain-containing protein [Acidimicrobiales bacterium]|nr:helix-turn-helix domain-containing protein [Acidimicrobiales bacterium]